MYTTFDKNAQRKHRHLRIRAKISGTAATPRVSIFRSNKFITASLIDDENHKTLASVSSAQLGLENPSTVAAATAVGEKLAGLASELKINTVVFDRSGYLYHGQVKAVAEALRSKGLVF